MAGRVGILGGGGRLQGVDAAEAKRLGPIAFEIVEGAGLPGRPYRS